MSAIVQSKRAQSIWRDLKRWRTVPLGPIEFVFKFARRHQTARAAPFLEKRPAVAPGIAEHPDVLSRGNAGIRQGPSPAGSAIVVGVRPGDWAKRSLAY